MGAGIGASTGEASLGGILGGGIGGAIGGALTANSGAILNPTQARVFGGLSGGLAGVAGALHQALLMQGLIGFVLNLNLQCQKIPLPQIPIEVAAN